jgi:protein phosphatase
MRKHNEDAHLEGHRVFAVADGVGGNVGGDVASSAALMSIIQLEERVFSDAVTAREALQEAFIAANTAVLQKASEDPALRGMGTTLTAALVDGQHLHVGHVGDSRAYLFRNGQLTQLTRDHTVVGDLIAAGELTAEEATTHPMRSAIARAIGGDMGIDVDVSTIELIDGDQLLLCSDGLVKPVSEDEIVTVLSAESNANEAAERLVDLANEHGGPDNITVVLLRYAGAAAPSRDEDTPVDFIPNTEQLDAHSDIGAGDAPQAASDRYSRIRWRRIAVFVIAVGLLGAAAFASLWLG